MIASMTCLFSFDRSQILHLIPPLLMMGPYSRSLNLVPRGSTTGFIRTRRTPTLVLRPDDVPQITAGALWDLATTQPAGGAPHKARIFLRRYEITQEYHSAGVGMVRAPAGVSQGGETRG